MCTSQTTVNNSVKEKSADTEEFDETMFFINSTEEESDERVSYSNEK